MPDCRVGRASRVASTRCCVVCMRLEADRASPPRLRNVQPRLHIWLLVPTESEVNLCSGRRLSADGGFLVFPHLLLVPCSCLRSRVPGLIPFGIDRDSWFRCAGTGLISGFRLVLAFCGACTLPLASRASRDAFSLFVHFCGVSPARAWARGVM